MSLNINFGDYLLENERWLNDETEAKGHHETNEKLDGKELSIFFTEHLDFVNDEGELDINEESFDKWYEANQQAINMFFESLDIENNEAAKEALFESISAFAKENEEAILNPEQITGEEDNTLNNDRTIDDETAELYANQLYEAMKGLGTDDEQVAAILDLELSDADLTKIMEIYNEAHGSLVNDIDGDFSGETRKKYEELFSGALVNQAENGDETALKLLCEEIHNATAGKIGTSDEFIAGVFDKINDDNINVLTQVIEKYNDYTGSDIFEDINGDFSSDTKKKYLEKLNKAMQKTDLPDGRTIDDDTAELYANRLYEAMKGLGTDDEQVAAILDSGLSDTDLIKVMEIYNEAHGSLIKDIDGDFSGKTQDKYEELFATALVNGVKSGDETALKLLCQEMHNATLGMLGTADEFIAKIFNMANTPNDGYALMKTIKDNYSKYNDGENIYDILKDFSGFDRKYYQEILDAAG